LMRGGRRMSVMARGLAWPACQRADARLVWKLERKKRAGATFV
jgi:hypothetical protein